MKIPARGLSKDQTLALLAEQRGGSPWAEGKMFSFVFLGDEPGREVAEAATQLFLWENGLDPLVFPALARFENEVVAMSLDHLGAGPEAVGSFTSGGTESVMLAVKAARDHALARGVEGPVEMVLPATAHPCFHKAAAYLGVRAIVTPVDPARFTADVSAMRQAITDRTALLVGSAPSYAHGVVDPIPELGALARERGLLLHIDGCIGAFTLPFFRRLGVEFPDFDLSVPGVTSISMDLHKYGYVPKGASVVLYNDAALRRHQLFVFSDWPGYSIVNPTVQSSKSGGPLAAAWAALHYYGDDGLMAIARALKGAVDRLVEGIDAIEGLSVMAPPAMTLIAVRGEGLCVFSLCEEMKRRGGWYIHPQFRSGPLPENFHLTVVPRNVDQIEPFLADLAACVAAQREGKRRSGGGLAEAIAGLDLASLDDAALAGLIAQLGLAGGKLENRGEVNQILNALPAAVRDRLLLAYVDALFRPARD
ncbi:MAG: aspartate aminotransferase family protein [Myxococcales bacterium]|nr:aspartate aminotransferase family protein [Myxococcales bacterium]